MDLIREIIEFLHKLDYTPVVEVNEILYDISFTSFGFDAFKYKDEIRKLAGDKLAEFYYGANTQHIRIRV